VPFARKEHYTVAPATPPRFCGQSGNGFPAPPTRPHNWSVVFATGQRARIFEVFDRHIGPGGIECSYGCFGCVDRVAHATDKVLDDKCVLEDVVCEVIIRQAIVKYGCNGSVCIIHFYSLSSMFTA
jgi:hypothetical protein